ncbi:MAG: hypothetical protein ABSF27_07610 [Candidatus Dormibacteria bacterium]|jgi:hypothetical protein
MPDRRRWRSRAGLAGATLLGSGLVVGYLWVGLVGTAVSSGSLFTIRLTGKYYPAFVGWLTGEVSETSYVMHCAPRALEEHGAVVWIRQNHLAASTAVIWSPDAWACLLRRLEPILPSPPST